MKSTNAVTSLLVAPYVQRLERHDVVELVLGGLVHRHPGHPQPALAAVELDVVEEAGAGP